MASIDVKFGQRIAMPRFRWSVPAFGISFLFLGWLLLGELNLAILCAGIGLPAGFATCYIRKKLYLNRRFKVAKKFFETNGHRAEFQLMPQLLISPSTKTIAIVNGFAQTYDEYRFSEIIGWGHSWKDKTETSSSMLSASTRSKTHEVRNILSIRTSNPYRPLYEFHLFAHSHGQLWKARFDALFNSQ